MSKIWCWLIHDWSQWSAARDEAHVHTVRFRTFMRMARVQGRSCYRCGKITERVVRVLAERPALQSEMTIL